MQHTKAQSFSHKNFFYYVFVSYELDRDLTKETKWIGEGRDVYNTYTYGE